MPPRPGYVRPTVQPAVRPQAQPAQQPLGSSFEVFTWSIVAALEQAPEALALLDLPIATGELYARYKDELRRRTALTPPATPVQAAMDALPEVPAAASVSAEAEAVREFLADQIINASDEEARPLSCRSRCPSTMSSAA